MAVTYFHVMQTLPPKNTFRRRYPEAYAKKLAVKPGVFIITGVIFISRAMLFIWRVTFGGPLLIKPVKRGYGKERRDLIRNFEAYGVRFYTPVILVIPVI